MPNLAEQLQVLVVDDEKNIRTTLKMILEGEDYGAEIAGSAEEMFETLGRQRFSIILLDIKLPGMDGITALDAVRKKYPDTEVIMISGHAGISDAVAATKLGAYNFLEKPLDRERVMLSVRNCAEKFALRRQVQSLTEGRLELLGRSASMLRLLDEIARVAPTNGRVLISGESGTGKELAARAIHRNSKRAEGPFEKVNCAAIPQELIESELFGHERGSFSGASCRKRGKFELAHGGTLFLDEIADMSPSAQAKVLRVLQTGEISRVGSEKTINIDVRVIAASNKRLEDEIKAGRFREDLFFRLNVVPLRTPPLREHLDDVPLLVARFIEQFCRENGFKTKKISQEAVDALRRHSWPGNVRELKNLIERLVIMAGETIGISDIPDYITGHRPRFDVKSYGDAPLKDVREMVEREYIREKLLANDWNILKTAEALGVERTNLHKKIKYYKLKRED